MGWVLLLLLLLVPVSALGVTTNVANCAPATIQAAHDAAAVGDLLHLPACTFTTWNTTVTITKRIILEGTGVATTILRREAVAATEANPMFRVSAGVTGFELRHLQLNGTQDTHPGTYRDLAFELLSAVDFVVHHVQIDSFALGILIRGDALIQRGLIYESTFTGNFCAPTCGGGTALGSAVAVYGNDTSPTMDLGTAQNVFVEENTFTANRHAVITGIGARLTFRHNTIVDNREDAAAMEIQGVVPTLGTHGTRQVELVNNTVTNSVVRLAGILMRGGDGVIAHNSFSSNLTDEIRLSNHTACTGTHPLPEQIQDLYLWGNVLNESGPAGIVVAAGCATYIQENRDYRLVERPGYVPFSYPHPHRGGLPPDLTSGLEMHLAFDDNVGLTAQDSTANNHDGTLGSGASWGAGTLGPSSVVLDGTGNPTGRVLVTGELTQPTAATLAAWIWPTAFPNVNAEVLSLGNHLVLRVSATALTGFTYTGGGAWTTTTAAVTIPTTGWTHVAYTTEPGAQRLYVNGALLAQTTSATPVSWVGLGANTILGAHGDTLTFRFQGRIDEARVYTRALTAQDLAALAALADPTAVTVQILTPTSGPAFNTTSALLATVGGSASALTGVTQVTWNCPTCTPPFGDAVCTPDCGPAPLAVSWHVPALTLGAGSHLFTVTATDGTVAVQDSVTLTYTPPGAAPPCTHWASQVGGGNGLAVGSPVQVLQFWALATPGSVLCLKDDTYTGANSMVTPPAGLSGTVSLPITVQALNEGAALLDGQNVRNPVVLASTNQWFVVRGLNAKNGLTSVYQFLGSNNRGTKLIGWNATSGQLNATIFTVTGTNTVVEDAAGWGTNARVIFQGSGTVSSPNSGYRRVWGEWNDHPQGGVTGGACAQPGKDQFLENLVCTVNKTGD